MLLMNRYIKIDKYPISFLSPKTCVLKTQHRKNWTLRGHCFMQN